MTGCESNDELRLGFLAAQGDPDQGFVGGLLVTNHRGRPLEFQCTTPVKPNRVQEILYGHTLVPFVLGELIGQTLLAKVGVKPHVVLVDRPGFLELREHVDVPVCLLSGSDADGGQESAEQGDAQSLRVGKLTLRIHGAHTTDRGIVEQRVRVLPDDSDLSEPFQRVRTALDEATRGGAYR